MERGSGWVSVRQESTHTLTSYGLGPWKLGERGEHINIWSPARRNLCAAQQPPMSRLSHYSISQDPLCWAVPLPSMLLSVTCSPDEVCTGTGPPALAHLPPQGFSPNLIIHTRGLLLKNDPECEVI